MDGIEDLFIMQAVNTIIYAMLVILIDYNLFSYIIFRIQLSCNKKNYEQQQKQQEEEFNLDLDVIKEQNRIYDQYHSDIKDDDLLVYELVKYFKLNAAVKGVSFGVHNGECFGLLGVNGAGKTTLFRMMTGDLIRTNGDVIVNDYRLSKNRRRCLEQFGYCPQFSALNETLTGRELLKTFACLRGVPAKNIKHEVNKWINAFNLNDYADKVCNTYSGGNKRKLNTAMALIAEPQIILLDEPTSGVDPSSRRHIWTVLANIEKNQCIVLTTHSMNECEALCNRLAIMVNGQLKCLGSVPYLKRHFSQGFTIILKIKSTINNTNLKSYIEQAFSDCELVDEHEGLLHYHIKNTNITWYQLFNTIEQYKMNPSNDNIIEDYTVNETTLEEVFLSFAKQKMIDQKERRGGRYIDCID